MQASTAKDELLDYALEIEPEQFERLCKIVVEQVETPRHIELTPFHGDGGIDIRGNVGADIFSARFGVQVKQFQNNIGTPAMRNFIGAISQHNYQFGAFITSSEFANGAVQVAQDQHDQPIELIDRNRLTNIMLDQELGVVTQGDEYDIDRDFWSIFDKTASDDPVPTDKVPQADSLTVLGYALKAIDRGYRYNPEITDYIARKTGDDWTRRQGDYYPAAGYALDYVHKDTMGEYQDRQMRKWGLTRDGQEYIELLESGDTEIAHDDFVDHVREMDIVQRILPVIEDEGKISHSRLKNLVFEESELNETTASRRATTVGQWIGELPEVKRKGHGATLAYEYLPTNLSDYSASS